MDQRGKACARRTLINFGMLTAALYIIIVTFFVVNLHRLVVSQSARIQTLESVTDELAARVDKLENSFTAQRTDQEPVGETGRVLEGKSARLKNKVSCFHDAKLVKLKIIAYSNIALNLLISVLRSDAFITKVE